MEIKSNPAKILFVAAVLTLVSLGFVYTKIDSMGVSEREATQLIQRSENIRGQIVLHGEILTSSTLMAAVTGNESWGTRFLEHKAQLEATLASMKQMLGEASEVISLTEISASKLLAYEYQAFDLIQKNKADEARRMLFGETYKQEKVRYEEAIAVFKTEVDAYIEKINKKTERTRDLTQRFILATLFLILAGWVFVLVTITRSQKEIRQLAYYDPLTGLASRRYFLIQIEKSIKSAHRRGEGLTLLFMDLDGFKDVNDTMGHDTGDHLLEVVACRLKTVFRESDFIARLGGDEFCILLEKIWEPRDIESSVERCIEAIEKTVDLSVRQIRPRTSIGIARYPEDGTTGQQLTKSADSAMYSAKKKGKHRYEYYSSDLTLEAEQRLTLVSDLREAIQNDEFILHYQPIIDLQTGFVEGVEALVRWQHPRRGLLPPVEFISELERMGSIDWLGNWVLEHSCEQALDWQYRGRPLNVGVNISPQHFLSSGFAKSVKSSIEQTGISPERVVLEVTETTIQDGAWNSKNVSQLRELGVVVAIDDFGTGYSSLGSLKNAPIDILKIDRVFIKDLINGSREAIMLEAIIGMAHALGLKVIAEGVEEPEHVEELKTLGCDLAQGFYFGRPVTAIELQQSLSSGNFNLASAEHDSSAVLMVSGS